MSVRLWWWVVACAWHQTLIKCGTLFLNQSAQRTSLTLISLSITMLSVTWATDEIKKQHLGQAWRRIQRSTDFMNPLCFSRQKFGRLSRITCVRAVLLRHTLQSSSFPMSLLYRTGGLWYCSQIFKCSKLSLNFEFCPAPYDLNLLSTPLTSAIRAAQSPHYCSHFLERFNYVYSNLS